MAEQTLGDLIWNADYEQEKIATLLSDLEERQAKIRDNQMLVERLTVELAKLISKDKPGKNLSINLSSSRQVILVSKPTLYWIDDNWAVTITEEVYLSTEQKEWLKDQVALGKAAMSSRKLVDDFIEKVDFPQGSEEDDE